MQVLFAPVMDIRSATPIGWDARPITNGDTADAPIALRVLEVLSRTESPPDDALVFLPVDAAEVGDAAVVDASSELRSRLVFTVSGREARAVEDVAHRVLAVQDAGHFLALSEVSLVGLGELASIRPAFIRLDPAHVHGFLTDPSSRAVVESYVGFAREAGLHVIADGVDHRDQVDGLGDIGISFAAGPLFGPPSPPWSSPRRSRRRPELGLAADHEVHTRLERATTFDEVAATLCETLAIAGLLPAVYRERDGVLRCVAHLGRPEVIDGIPARSGVLGQAFSAGREEVVTTLDDLRAAGTAPSQLLVPIRVGGRVVGVADLHADGPISAEVTEYVRSLVARAEQRLATVRVEPVDSPLHRLARANMELASLTDQRLVAVSAARLACDVSGLSSAAIAIPGARGELEHQIAQGPLARQLERLPSRLLAELLGDLGSAAACWSTESSPAPGSLLAILRTAGAATTVVLPVRTDEAGTGLLVVADHAPVRLDLDHREAVELLARDIARSIDRVSVIADLRTQATVDRLTGLGNRAAFDEALSAIGGRRRGRWAVVMADVDGLKQVNDTHGHLAGDLALRTMADAVNEVLRVEDRMFRVGGDEFAAVLHDVDEEGALDVGRRMCEAAAEVMGDFGAGLSVGIAVPGAGEKPSEFLDRADQALYASKRSRRGGASVASTQDADAPA